MKQIEVVEFGLLFRTFGDYSRRFSRRLRLQ